MREVTRRIGVLGLALLAAVGLSACGGEEGESGPEEFELSIAIGIELESANEDGEEDEDAEMVTVAPDRLQGEAGDGFRIVLKPMTEGFCYILNRGSSGAYALLFPNRAWKLTNNYIKEGEDFSLPPSDDGLWLRFDETAGTEQLTIVYAKERVDVMEGLISVGNPGNDEIAQAVADLAEQGGMTSTQKDVTDELTTFTYSGATEDPFMVVTVDLRHE
jgi:hypothetical protein